MDPMNWTDYQNQPHKKPLSYGQMKGKAAEFKLLRLRELPVEKTPCDNPQPVVKFWHDHVATAQWFDAEKECLIVVMLDTRRKVTGFHLISLGTLDTIIVHPREVFRPAVMQGAAAIILAHNHPSGDPSPSEADIKVTRDLIRGGQLLKIEVLDHIVIGRETDTQKKGYASLRELGYFYL